MTLPDGSRASLGVLIREDLRAHGGDLTRPGFRAVVVCRFGQWRMTIRRRLFRAPATVLYRLLYVRVRNRYGIELPFTVKLGRRVVIEHQSGVVVHGLAEIGDECVIRQGVTIGNRYADRPLECPKLGRGVSIGAGAVIIGSVTIGDFAKIGANSVVLQDVPPNRTAVGNPATLLPKHDE